MFECDNCRYSQKCTNFKVGGQVSYAYADTSRYCPDLEWPIDKKDCPECEVKSDEIRRLVNARDKALKGSDRIARERGVALQEVVTLEARVKELEAQSPSERVFGNLAEVKAFFFPHAWEKEVAKRIGWGTVMARKLAKELRERLGRNE